MVDLEAERVVVGVCLATRHGIGHVYRLISPASFSSWELSSLYTAALQMGDLQSLDERVEFAVKQTSVSCGRVRELVCEAPVMFDSSPWAKRVAEAAQKRKVMQQAVETFRDAAGYWPWER